MPFRTIVGHCVRPSGAGHFWDVQDLGLRFACLRLLTFAPFGGGKVGVPFDPQVRFASGGLLLGLLTFIPFGAVEETCLSERKSRRGGRA